jgi:hypothetical protein
LEGVAKWMLAIASLSARRISVPVACHGNPARSVNSGNEGETGVGACAEFKRGLPSQKGHDLPAKTVLEQSGQIRVEESVTPTGGTKGKCEAEGQGAAGEGEEGTSRITRRMPDLSENAASFASPPVPQNNAMPLPGIRFANTYFSGAASRSFEMDFSSSPVSGMARISERVIDGIFPVRVYLEGFVFIGQD